MAVGTWQLLDGLRTCLVGELIKKSRPVCNLPVIWGSSPLPAQRCDCTCEDGGEGEGWVRLVSSTPIPPPTGTNRARIAMTGCGTLGWDLRIEFGVWRCAPTLDDQGNPPGDEEYAVHTKHMLADMHALQSAWDCCEWLKNSTSGKSFDSIIPSGPMGGCSGVIGTGVIRLEGCGC